MFLKLFFCNFFVDYVSRGSTVPFLLLTEGMEKLKKKFADISLLHLEKGWLGLTSGRHCTVKCM